MQEHLFLLFVECSGLKAIMAGSFELQQAPCIAPFPEADLAKPNSSWLTFDLFWRGSAHGDYTSSLGSIFQQNFVTSSQNESSLSEL